MDDDRKAFTVPFPEARKIRTANTLWLVFFFLVWILLGVRLFGPPEIPGGPILTVMTIAFALSIGFSIYGTRKQKELGPVINHRFAEEFTAHTSARQRIGLRALGLPGQGSANGHQQCGDRPSIATRGEAVHGR